MASSLQHVDVYLGKVSKVWGNHGLPSWSTEDQPKILVSNGWLQRCGVRAGSHGLDFVVLDSWNWIGWTIDHFVETIHDIGFATCWEEECTPDSNGKAHWLVHRLERAWVHLAKKQICLGGDGVIHQFPKTYLLECCLHLLHSSNHRKWHWEFQSAQISGDWRAQKHVDGHCNHSLPSNHGHRYRQHYTQHLQARLRGDNVARFLARSGA